MNKDKQRIAIAEYCGWTCCGCVQELQPHGLAPWLKVSDYTTAQVLNHEVPIDTLPDYLGDLNAMHEVEKLLGDLGSWALLDYDQELALLTDSWKWNATAEQKAEAFLRTIGKWEDGE